LSRKNPLRIATAMALNALIRGSRLFRGPCGSVTGASEASAGSGFVG
jgi:hypothetical protein